MPDIRLSDDLQKQEREYHIKADRRYRGPKKTSPPGSMLGGLMSPLALPAIDFLGKH
jgi:hypothetical protein